jgi:hypothetical protein
LQTVAHINRNLLNIPPAPQVNTCLVCNIQKNLISLQEHLAHRPSSEQMQDQADAASSGDDHWA